MTTGRITQGAVEVLRVGDPHARITQAAVEVLRTGDPDVRVTQVAIEVLRSVTGVSSGGILLNPDMLGGFTQRLRGGF